MVCNSFILINKKLIYCVILHILHINFIHFFILISSFLDFNESDLQISIQQLQLFVQNYEHMPFDAITYLIGECNYGGRVTDERDRRCLITILKDFFNPDVITNLNYSFVDIDSEYTIPKKYLLYTMSHKRQP